MILQKYKLVLLLLFVACITTPSIYAQQISSLIFTGLERTNYSYLYNFVHSHPNTVLDSAQLKRDRQQLLNLKLFEYVEYAVHPLPDSTIQVEFKMQEVFTLLPNLDIGIANGLYRIQTGFNDFNSLGKGGELSLYLKYFMRFSVMLSGDYPYIFKKGNGIGFNLQLNSTIEPLYLFNNSNYRVDLNYNQYQAFVYYRKDFDIHTFLKLGTGYFKEDYVTRSDNDIPLSIRENWERILVRNIITNRHLNYTFSYVEGFQNEFTAEYNYFINTTIDTKGYLRLQNEFKYFAHPYPSGNFAVRARIGLSSDQLTIFGPYYLDSYLNIRGIGNKPIRGNSEITLNIEHRQTVFSNRLGAVGVVAFSDIGHIEYLKPRETLFNNFDIGKTFIGGGLRLFILKLHSLNVRFDYGINVKNSKERGYVFGINQYF